MVQLGADFAVLTVVAIDAGANASLVAEPPEGFVAVHCCANANLTRIAFHPFITGTGQQALWLLRFKLVREKRRPPRPPSALQRSIIETRGSAQALATEPRGKAGASREYFKALTVVLVVSSPALAFATALRGLDKFQGGEPGLQKAAAVVVAVVALL